VIFSQSEREIWSDDLTPQGTQAIETHVFANDDAGDLCRWSALKVKKKISSQF